MMPLVLKKKPRLAVFNAWLSDTVDPDRMPSHLDKVVKLAQVQHEHNLGFILITEPPITRLEQSNNMLREKFSGLAVEQLGVGMCNDGLIVNNSLSSQLVTNINEVVTSLKHCSNHIEKKQSIESLYSLNTTDVLCQCFGSTCR